MSKLYNGGASFGFSLNYNTAVPVDTRFVVNTLDDLKDPRTWISGNYDSGNDANNVYVVYPGLQVVVLSEGTLYVFKSNTVNGTTLASDDSWSRIATGDSTNITEDTIGKLKTAIGLDNEGNHVATSGNYTSDATTIAGEISALDTQLKSTNDLIGTIEDDSTKNTVFGKIAKEIEDLDSSFDKSDTAGFVNLKISQVDGKITSVEVATSDIMKRSDITNSKTLGGETTIELTASIKYVAAKENTPAHIALVDSENTELSTINVSDIIGNGVLKNSNYDSTTGILKLTFAKSDGTDNEIDIDLGKMLDIDDVLIHTDSQDYLSVDLTGSEQSQAVFKALIVKMADATNSNTGLVDAYDIKQYVDDKTSISAEGDDYVEASLDNKKVSISTNISALTFNEGALTGTEHTLVDGKDLAEKVTSYVEAKIEDLDSTKEDTGTNVKVTVEETDGKISNVTVEETYSTVKVENKVFSATDTGLITGSDLSVAVSHVKDDIIGSLDLASTEDNAKAQDTKGYVKTTISETDGLVKNEGVSVTYGSFDNNTNGIATVEDVKGNTRFEKGDGTNSAILKGTGVTANNEGEVALGKYNNSVTHASDESAKTIFSIGNGSSSSDLSNAIEVRENGDIWINIGDDYKKLQTILSNEIDWYEGD